jgi:hypothetical protein
MVNLIFNENHLKNAHRDVLVFSIQMFLHLSEVETFLTAVHSTASGEQSIYTSQR